MTTSTVDVTLPIFITMALGAVAMVVGVIDGVFISKTNQFLFKIVLPIVVFRSIVNIPEFSSDFVKVSLTYVFTLIIITPVILALALIRTKLSAKTFLERFQIAFSSTAWANTVILGIPLVTALFDEAQANLYAVLQILPTQIVFLPTNLVLIEVIKARREGNELSKKALAKMILIRTATSPLMIAVALGLVASTFMEIKKNTIIGDAFALVARVLTPMGVVVAGAFLEKQIAILVKTGREKRRAEKAAAEVLDVSENEKAEKEAKNEKEEAESNELDASESDVEMVVEEEKPEKHEESNTRPNVRTKHDEQIDEELALNRPDVVGGKKKPCECNCDCERLMREKQKKVMREIAKLEILRPVLLVITRMYLFPLIGYFVSRLIGLDKPEIVEMMLIYMALPTTFVSFAMQLAAKVEAHVTPIAIIIGMVLLPFHIAMVRWFVEKMMS